MQKGFLKRLIHSQKFQTLLAWIGVSYVKLVYKTSSWVLEGAHYPQHYWEKNVPFILCFWHERLLMLCSWHAEHWSQQKPPVPLHMLVSPSFVGKLIIAVMEHFSIKAVQGSSNKQTIKAFREMLHALQSGEGCIGITPDGPRGPRHSVQNGFLKLALHSGADIIPIAYSVSRKIHLSSWDRFLLPLPWSRGSFVIGRPLVSKDFQKKDLTVFRAAVTESLSRVTQRSDDLCRSLRPSK